MSKQKRSLILATAFLGLFIWVANASRTGPLESCLSNCSRATLPASDQIRILDFNMLHGFPLFQNLARRVDIIASKILRLDPDIVCLQEVPWTIQTGSVARKLAASTGMNYVYSPANGNRWAILFSEGEAILSKFPIKSANYFELAPRPGPFEHRIALHATIETSEVEIQVICTHLSHRESTINAGQVESLMDYLDSLPDGPAILAGDFNAEEDSPQIERLTKEWNDVYRITHPLDRGLTCCIANLESPDVYRPDLRIDYLFVRADSNYEYNIIRSDIVFDHPFPSQTGQIWASDHFGVFAELIFLSQNN